MNVISISHFKAQLLAERGRIRLDTPPGEWIDREHTRFPLRDAAVTRARRTRERHRPAAA